MKSKPFAGWRSFAIAALMGVPLSGLAAPTDVVCPLPVQTVLTQGLGSPPGLREVAAISAPHLRIGTATAAAAVAGPYRDILVRDFAMVTPENQMKFAAIHPQPDVYNFCQADLIVEQAIQNNQLVRGHTLVWHRQLPAWITDNEASFTRDQLLQIMRDHIHHVVGHFRDKYPGRVVHWDVVNEAVTDCSLQSPCPLRLHDDNPTNNEDDGSIWARVIGSDYIERAYAYAREADPNAVLFYNDYGIEGASQVAKREGVKQLVGALVDAGVEIDAVGLQSHVYANHNWTGSTVSDLMDWIIARRPDRPLEVGVTELDVAFWGYGVTTDLLRKVLHVPSQAELGLQAQVFGTFLDACVVRPGCKTFALWEFSDADSWLIPDKPTPYDLLYRPKAAYVALRNRLLRDLPEKAGEVVAQEAESLVYQGSAALPLNTLGARDLRGTGDTVHGAFALGGSDRYQVSFIAKGTSAAGVWPRVELRVDGTLMATVEVNQSTWKEYAVPLPAIAAGARDVALTFINDGYFPPQDRNVSIDKISVSSILEAEHAHYRSTGFAVPDGWAMHERGYIENSVTFGTTGTHMVKVVARGTPGMGGWPRIALRVNGVPLAFVDVTSADWAEYRIPFAVAQGTFNVSLAYQNDTTAADGDRNLFIDKFAIVGHRPLP